MNLKFKGYKMNILITGATGMVGKSLVPELQKLGHNISITTRDKNTASTIFNSKVNFIEWKDFHHPIPVGALQNVNGVIHLMGENIGAKRWSQKQKILLAESRIESAKNIIKTINDNKISLDFFITSSAVGIYPTNLEHPIDEEHFYGVGFLAQLCKSWEEVSKTSQYIKRVCAIRTGVVLGAHEGAMAKMLPIFKLGLGGPIGDGRQMMSWIHLKDLVAIYAKAVSDQSFEGAFNAVAPNPVDNFTFSKELAHALHRPSLLLTPALPLKIILGEMSTIVLDSQYVVPKRLQTKTDFKFTYPTVSEAFRDLFG